MDCDAEYAPHKFSYRCTARHQFWLHRKGCRNCTTICRPGKILPGTECYRSCCPYLKNLNATTPSPPGPHPRRDHEDSDWEILVATFTCLGGLLISALLVFCLCRLWNKIKLRRRDESMKGCQPEDENIPPPDMRKEVTTLLDNRKEDDCRPLLPTPALSQHPLRVMEQRVPAEAQSDETSVKTVVSGSRSEASFTNQSRSDPTEVTSTKSVVTERSATDPPEVPDRHSTVLDQNPAHQLDIPHRNTTEQLKVHRVPLCRQHVDGPHAVYMAMPNTSEQQNGAIVLEPTTSDPSNDERTPEPTTPQPTQATEDDRSRSNITYTQTSMNLYSNDASRDESESNNDDQLANTNLPQTFGIQVRN